MSALSIAMKTPPHRWTHAQLCQLRNVELECLCQLLGVPHSGTKPAKVARLLDMAELRTRLSPFERPDQLADRYRLRDLQRMARRAGTYRPHHQVWRRGRAAPVAQRCAPARPGVLRRATGGARPCAAPAAATA